MNILNRYIIEDESGGFVLKTKRVIISKDGKEKEIFDTSYHGRFKDCLYKIIDNEAKGCPTVEQLLKRYDELESFIKKVR